MVRSKTIGQNVKIDVYQQILCPFSGLIRYGKLEKSACRGEAFLRDVVLKLTRGFSYRPLSMSIHNANLPQLLTLSN